MPIPNAAQRAYPCPVRSASKLRRRSGERRGRWRTYEPDAEHERLDLDREVLCPVLVRLGLGRALEPRQSGAERASVLSCRCAAVDANADKLAASGCEADASGES